MRRVLILAVLLLVTLAACGSDDGDSADAGSDDAASSGLAPEDDGGDAVTSGLVDDEGGSDGEGDPPDPCELLTIDDVSGQGIAAASGPTPTEGARFPECRFADAEGRLVLQVQVFAPEDTGGLTSGQVDVAGLGEAAVYNEGNRTLTIDLSDGSQIVLYSPFDAEPADPRDTLIELGRIAAG